MRKFVSVVMCLATLGLTACVSGGGESSSKTVAASVSIVLTDTTTTGATVTSISTDKPAKVSATVRDTSGAVVPNLVVTFTTDSSLATMAPSTGTALTDAAGVASIQISPASLTAAGATTISVAATVSGTPVSASVGYSVSTGSSSSNLLTLELTKTDVSLGTKMTATARVLDPLTRKPVPNSLVTFEITGGLARLSPSSGTALTNEKGEAEIDIFAAGPSEAGAVSVSATTAVGAVSLTKSTGFSVISNPTATEIRVVLSTRNIKWGSPTPVDVTAEVWNSGALAPDGTVVSFATASDLVTMIPTSGTALTEKGKATIQIVAATPTAAGAGTITATAKPGSATISGAANYSVSTAFTGAASLQLALSSTTLSSSVPTTVTAAVTDAANVVVKGAVVTFTTNPTIGLIAPAAATALTNEKGLATVTLSPASLTAAGAATIIATSQVGTTTVTDSKGYYVGAAAVTLDKPVIGDKPPPNTLSAFGTTSVSVVVRSGGIPIAVPQTVSFSSPCSLNGKAVLTTNVATASGTGKATASYRDNGCGTDDPITASVSGFTPSDSAILTVTPPSAGSIQFI
ncbi:MAG: hypothetical protein NTX56_10125, partial [Proteobacteria bacterium]|nr:hypothetical protein [Pseudomonadota bacterium]